MRHLRWIGGSIIFLGLPMFQMKNKLMNPLSPDSVIQLIDGFMLQSLDRKCLLVI